MLTILLMMLVIFLLGIIVTILSGVIACLPIILVFGLFILMDVLLVKWLIKKRK